MTLSLPLLHVRAREYHIEDWLSTVFTDVGYRYP